MEPRSQQFSINKKIDLKVEEVYMKETLYQHNLKMPSPNYFQNKKHIYKWRESHMDRSREINKLFKRRYDCWKKNQKEFLLILID